MEIYNEQKESSWRGVVDLPEAIQLLKYILEAVPTINSYDNKCIYDAQEYYFMYAHNLKKKKRRLSKLNCGNCLNLDLTR